MKRLITTFAAILAFSLLGFAAPKDRSFKGEIMDSACANAGSHEGMMKKAGLTTPKECTEACIKNGSKYVLFNPATKKVYQLDDQTKPEQFAGDHVKVNGTLDKTTSTIHVTDIEAASNGKKTKAAKSGL